MQFLLNIMGYEKGVPLQFMSRRVFGLWLLWVSAVIVIGTIFGGTQKINMGIFDVGYFIGFALILGNKKVYKRLAYGSPSRFQKKMIYASIILMFILLVLMGGPYFATHNFRMIWLAAFLAIGIHFIPFAMVHGKIVLPLAALVSANAIAGIFLHSVDFQVFAYVDAAIKVLYGIVLLRSANPFNKAHSPTISV